MNIVYVLLIGFFLLTWAICFLPQIRLFFPRSIPGAPSWVQGGAMLCFCALRCTKEEYELSTQWKTVARHEYCHQIQQRFLSPLGLAILYLGEVLIRRIFMEPDWKSAYWNVSWEKQARRYMDEI